MQHSSGNPWNLAFIQATMIFLQLVHSISLLEEHSLLRFCVLNLHRMEEKFFDLRTEHVEKPILR